MVKFTYEDKEYTLGFNRKTAEAAQTAGLDTDEISTKPLVQVPLLVYWAFQMHHPSIKKSKTEEIYSKINGKTELLKALVADFISTYKDLFGGDDDEDEGEDNENLISWSAE